MDTIHHNILSQYIEWFTIAKSWLARVSKLDALIIFLGVWFVYRIGVYTYRLFLHPLSKYPGPRLAAASSIYEIYHDLFKADMAFHMDDLHRQYGPLVRIAPNKVRLRKSSAYHEVHRVGSPFIKDYGFYRLFGLAKATFSIIDPVVHRKQRKVLDIMFSRRSIMDLEHLVHSKVNFLCQRIKALEAQNCAVNFFQAFVALTVDIITEYAYAKSYNALSTEGFRSRAVDAFDAQQQSFMVLKSFPLVATLFNSLPPWLLIKIFPDGAGFRELELDAENQLKDLLQRIKTGEKSTTHRTVFEEMLDGYADPHPEDLVHEAVSVVGAGMHTTRWILCVGALEVARNVEVASKLAQELKKAIPDVNGSLSYLEMESLPYLRGVVNESLRLGYGIVGSGPRVVPAGGAVVGGYRLPKDAVIEIDHYGISHDEEIFPDSHKFSPERWIGPEAKSKEKYIVAFGAGSRQCLGINLAYCEIYIMFAYLFRRFELDAVGKDHMVCGDHWMPILRGEQLTCKVRSRED